MQAEGLILAGGQSVRMGGRHKGSLIYGNGTFTDNLARELKEEAVCVRISYGREKRGDGGDCPPVMDIYPGCGPIGGLHAGLMACGREWLLAVACDMPLLKAELFRLLKERIREEEGRQKRYDGAVPVTDGRIHPLAAVYRKCVVSVLEEQIEAGNYRLCDALARLHLLYVDVTGQAQLERMLRNINTLEEYERLMENE